MHITCPHCEIKFTIPSDKISNVGRYVRCSKCGYLWHTKNPEITNEQDKITPINDYIKQEGVNLPVIVANNNLKYTRFFILIISLSIVLILSYLIWDFLRDGILDKKLQIKDVRVISCNENNLTVQYVIVCKECSFVQVPLIKFKLYDKNFKLLHSYLSKDLFRQLIDSNNVRITTDLIDVPEDIEYLDITLENYSDLFLK